MIERYSDIENLLDLEYWKDSEIENLSDLAIERCNEVDSQADFVDKDKREA